MKTEARHVVGSALLIVLACVAIARAAPTSVEHIPAAPAYDEPPDTTQREPEIPREDDAVTIYFRVSFQFTYDRVAVYFTTDGSEPNGLFGVGSGTTQVHSTFNGLVTFVRNESTMEGVRDWWKTTLPISARVFGQTIRYKLGAWSTGGGGEIQANGGNPYAYTNKLAWPGAGAGAPNPQEGYPSVYFWKEEALIGNQYINVMLDQNGTVFDMFYPGAGAHYGVGTRNEGYAGGNDTFPAFTSGRGQMHVNQLMCGIRVDGLTHWLNNPNAVSFDQITQSYTANSNTVQTSARLFAGGNDILVQQYDFCPAGIEFPLTLDNVSNRGIYIKRFILTNQSAVAKTVNFYAYGDFAINGGDGSDAMYQDTGAAHGAMIAYDNAGGSANSRGEYNPTFFADYAKEVSIFFGAALKRCNAVGSAAGTPATDSWRDTSADNGQGWIGLQVTLPPGTPVEIDLAVAGGFTPDDLDGQVGDRQVRPVFDWFFAQSMAGVQSATDAYWQAWLSNGVTVDLPDDRFDEVFVRGLLATALHVDGEHGALVAGYHNGAYPFCWPRDAVYGAVCLARTGHLAEAAGVYAWMRDTCYRDPEPWGRGFWKQKYTTNGYTIWSAPQIDETAVFPWGVYYQFLVTGDASWLSSHYATVKEAAITMSSSPSDPGLLPFLNYNATERLMWSNNVWEDSYGFFIYSNANVVRGLRDAASIATQLGNGADAADFTNRANTIQSGLDDALNANAEITDISQLGIVYPFQVYSPVDAKAVRYIDRVNGVHPDTSGMNHPLVNFTNRYGWLDLINRYHGDGYWGNGSAASPWGAGPWFLSTLWYGLYYAERQDHTPGRGDIDNHRYRVERLLDHLGPVGLGAEQIAPHCADNCPAPDCPNCGSLLYAGQPDFTLQTAWPNAWESMSTFVDAVMAFLDFRPDATTDRILISPKHPTGWSTMTFSRLPMRDRRVSVTCQDTPTYIRNAFTNEVGGTVNVSTTMRIPVGRTVFGATRDGVLISIASSNPAVGAYELTGALNGGVAAVTDFRLYYGIPGDIEGDGTVDPDDLPSFVAVLLGLDTDPIHVAIFNMNGVGGTDGADMQPFVEAMLP
ncbi:MAG: hypothetical protein L6Q92_05145 [Phycisphaerae bacterium]|nr:hypothetical protein [Phycisphaerae bacterium]